MNVSNKVIVWFEDLFETVWSKRSYVLGTIAGVFLLVCGGVGYYYYDQWAQRSAHKDFVAALKFHDAAVTGKKVPANHNGIEFETDQEKWTKTADVFKQGYNNHRRSGLASMFQAYQADALARLEKNDEAIAVLAEAIGSMPQKDLAYFYKVKLALLKMDNAKQAVQQEGIAELRKVADDATNFAHEAGLFYLGYYFWTQKDFDQARNYWQQLMVKYGMKEEKQQSGYAEIVRSKLKLISADW